MMKSALLLIALSALALAEVPIELDYHNKVGIPEAARIKQLEQAIDFDGSRIVGGAQTSAGVHPFLAGLLIALSNGATSTCGSSMLTNTRAVTAAHCWWSPQVQGRQMVMVFGSTFLYYGGVRVTTNQVALHANYNHNNLANDIAIISFGWVSYTNIIQRIVLPPANLLNNNFAGTWALAAGYGRTSDNTGITTSQAKHHVWLLVITNAVCTQTFGSGAILASTLCTSGAGGVGTCGGDSGGPLSITHNGQRTLIGVTSFGTGRCQAGHPSGFARVTSFVPWIQARI